MLAVSFGEVLMCGSKVGPNNATILVTYVTEIAKSVYKNLKKAELEEK